MPLPYASNALEPVLSQETIDFHYCKHHRKYVDTLSGLVREESGLAGVGLVDV
ncbi:MAG: superoxide dismutase [Fe], partial [Chakrabartia godavariana]